VTPNYINFLPNAVFFSTECLKIVGGCRRSGSLLDLEKEKEMRESGKGIRRER